MLTVEKIVFCEKTQHLVKKGYYFNPVFKFLSFKKKNECKLERSDSLPHERSEWGYTSWNSPYLDISIFLMVLYKNILLYYYYYIIVLYIYYIIIILLECVHSGIFF